MKPFINKILKNKYFLLFILVFAYAQSVHSRIVVRGELNIYTFTPEAAFSNLLAAGVLFLIISFFIKRWQKSSDFQLNELVKIFGASIILHVLTMQILSFIIAFIFGNVERNFNLNTFILTTFSHLLDGLIYGSFFLAYYYYIKNKKYRENLAVYNQALSESRINQLKSQLNPHFLFNNLNVLDQLIEEDKHTASEFLNEFADIYRFALQATEKKVIPISDEILFAKKYFNLMQHKYGNAYQLIIEDNNADGFIVPLTLQLLIENAIQHNLGTETNPVRITLATGKDISISNNLSPKRNNKAESGRALKNLEEQYKIVTGNLIGIVKTESTFIVTVPLIYSTKAI
jgi:sensor histidine kinase YesM